MNHQFKLDSCIVSFDLEKMRISTCPVMTSGEIDYPMLAELEQPDIDFSIQLVDKFDFLSGHDTTEDKLKKAVCINELFTSGMGLSPPFGFEYDGFLIGNPFTDLTGREYYKNPELAECYGEDYQRFVTPPKGISFPIPHGFQKIKGVGIEKGAVSFTNGSLDVIFQGINSPNYKFSVKNQNGLVIYSGQSYYQLMQFIEKKDVKNDENSND